MYSDIIIHIMKNRGFTLIELLVVISIVSLLSSVVLAALQTSREKARIAAGRQFEANILHASGDMLVGEWTFDNCTSSGAVVTTATDTSGYGSNGTPSGNPTWSSDTPTGKGCSLSLSGTNQYINMGNPTVLNMGTGDVTVSAWVKTSNSSDMWIVDKKYAGTNDAGFDLTTWRFRIANGSAQTSLAYSGVISDGLWHNVVGVVNRSDSNFYLYIDGKLYTKNSFTNTWDLSGTDVFLIGAYGGGTGGFFNGLIDNVRVFSKSLTASEVQRSYAQERVNNNLAIN
jgi:prepilin-type N-terminal cleavage/methylation domain-containing protein